MQKIIATLFVLVMPATIPAVVADEALPPIASDAVKSECSECHMAFQSQLLPKRSWVKIMATLENYFGEDASMDPARVSEIKAYLIANAADVSRARAGRKMLRNVSNDQTRRRFASPSCLVSSASTGKAKSPGTGNATV